MVYRETGGGDRLLLGGAFSDVVIVVRRLIREGWMRYVGKADLPAGRDLSAQALTCSTSAKLSDHVVAIEPG